MKKVISGFLVMALTVSILSACGKQEPQRATQEAQTAAKQVSDATEPTKEASEKIAEEEFAYPMKTDAVISIWGRLNTTVSANYSGLNDTPFAAGIIEKTGITVDYQHPPTGQDAEQFSLIMADGDFPDIMEYNWLSKYPGGPSKAIKDGVIIPLNDVMEKYCPNLMKYLAENPQVDNEIKTDEGIYYCFPRLKPSVVSRAQIGLVIRKDWMDQMKLEMPVTIDEWYIVLNEFKKFTGGSAPMTVECNKAEDFFRANPFLYAYGISSGFYLNADGKVMYGGVTPEYKEFLTTFAKWYKEGLLDPDFASLTLDQVTAKMTSGQSGCTFTRAGSRLGSWIPAGQKDNPDYILCAVVQPTKEKLAAGEIPEYSYLENVFAGNGAAITTGCENVEEAARFLDYGFSEAGHLYYNFGEEGVSYEMVNGYPTYTELLLKNPDGWTVGQAVSAYTRANVDAPVIEDTRYLDQYLVYDEQKEAPVIWGNTNGAVHILPPITYTEDESREFATITNEITSYQMEMSLKFIMGTENLDGYDEYVETMGRMNLDRAVEITQAAYDRYTNR